jgi:UPF0755 protein
LGKQLAKNIKKSILLSTLNILSVFIVLTILIVAIAVGILMYYNSPVNSNRPVLLSESDAIRIAEDGAYMIDIRRGETSQSVGLRLERAGLIRNRYFWNLICRFNNQQVKTGTYRVEMPASQIAIHRVLVSGREILNRVTIPEGVTLRKIASILEQAGICSAEGFLAAASSPDIINHYGIPNQTMEGYLYPDTYMFPSEYPAEQAVRKMADNFFAKIQTISPNFKTLNMKELNDKVILASIIEREYRIAEEAPLMAGVFFNRLRINMALQSCATVQYIITEIQGRPHPTVLLFRDLEIRNPYNTYIYPGLPPGPISAPGVVSLSAVMYPENTSYLYFRLIEPASGRHYFSRTHDEHIRAGQLIIKPTWP